MHIYNYFSIYRPASVKSEKSARDEALQRRITTLEVELAETRSKLEKEAALNESKRVKSAEELGLWEKQKK